MVAPKLSQNFAVNLYLVLAMFVLGGYKKEPLKVKQLSFKNLKAHKIGDFASGLDLTL